MKRLISRPMYHPLIALFMFYLTDPMYHVDCSVSGALLVLAAKSRSRGLSVFSKGEQYVDTASQADSSNERWKQAYRQAGTADKC
ncbi:hypothetical protein LMG28614_00242 [Paraburkholderia ultramafica]|uniref:Uncharacterized protein n=1 Tax=Paraburkholderia ultramafica TaxID=1544867 RepID=A0A6S7AV96_9BURK|nr:hypothetical protein LMG28614_00242 [Paraburkholderia ultramafica]